MKYEFFATSSSGMDVYIVTVSYELEKLVITCNCEAGKRDILCRHRIALITNKLHGIYTTPRKNNKEELRHAVSLVSKNGVDREYFKLQSLHDNLEKQWADVRFQLKKAMNDLVSNINKDNIN